MGPGKPPCRRNALDLPSTGCPAATARVRRNLPDRAHRSAARGADGGRPRPGRAVTRPRILLHPGLWSAIPPIAAVAAIAVVDAVYRSRPWSAPATAVLDEPAHLLTAWLIWIGVAPRRQSSRALPWVLTGAVAIDVDHLPLYLGAPGFLVDGGRPPTHSLATVVVLVLLSLLTRRYRFFGGLAVGVLLHLVRDLATGPGVPLGWPVVDVSVRVPYVVYAAAVAGAAGVLAVRGVRRLSGPHRALRDQGRRHHPTG